MTLRGYAQMDIRLDPVKWSMDFKGLKWHEMTWTHEMTRNGMKWNDLIEWIIYKWHEWLNDWTTDWLTDWINERTNERTNEWTNERMSAWTNERMNEWTNERTNERMNEWMNLRKYFYCIFILSVWRRGHTHTHLSIYVCLHTHKHAHTHGHFFEITFLRVMPTLTNDSVTVSNISSGSIYGMTWAAPTKIWSSPLRSGRKTDLSKDEAEEEEEEVTLIKSYRI